MQYQIFFLGLLTSASLAFLLRIWSRLSHPHHLAIFVLLPLPYLFTYLCVISTASEIKASNHFQEIQRYPFDYTLYHPGKVCSTCGLEKPARSKHCSTCKCCVAKADHHCAWVNSCIGRDNYRWFLALMLSLGIVLSYGAWLARGQMAPLVPTDHLWQGRHGLKGRIERWSSAIAKDVHIGAVGLLALLTAPLAWGLLAYHAYLIWAGMTTNETSKWSALREQMADGLFWKAKRSEVFSQRRGRPIQREGKKDRAFCVSWPIKTDQILLKESEVNLPDFPGLKADANGHSTWEKCWQLGQVENLYDLGFWDNFRDALCLEI